MARSGSRLGSMQFAFPPFSGATRRLVLWNLGAFFLLLLASAAHLGPLETLFDHLALIPESVRAGELWQVLTYSLVHPSLGGAFWDLLSLWFIGGFLESMHGGRWMTTLYFVSATGAGILAMLIFAVGLGTPGAIITGCLGGIMGMITAIALLHGELQFQLMFIIGIKAKYLAIIYILVAIAQTFTAERIYAFAQLGGAAAAILYVRFWPRRGLSFRLSEGWYALRNQYYRWKRRRAASKFQVYMKKQGRTVRFDGQGRLLDDDDTKHDDRKRWN